MFATAGEHVCNKSLIGQLLVLQIAKNARELRSHYLVVSVSPQVAKRSDGGQDHRIDSSFFL